MHKADTAVLFKHNIVWGSIFANYRANAAFDEIEILLNCGSFERVIVA